MKKNEVTRLYFAYGANLNLDGMHVRCPGWRGIGIGELEDHRLVFRQVADVEPVPGESVTGAVYALNAEHIRSLDMFEGYPHLYDRFIVPCQMKSGVLAGRTVDVIVYKMVAKYKAYDLPAPFYLNTILGGCNDWGIHPGQVDSALQFTRAKRKTYPSKVA